MAGIASIRFSRAFFSSGVGLKNADTSLLQMIAAPAVLARTPVVGGRGPRLVHEAGACQRLSDLDGAEASRRALAVEVRVPLERACPVRMLAEEDRVVRP